MFPRKAYRFAAAALAAAATFSALPAAAATLIFTVGDVTSGSFGNAKIKKGGFTDVLQFVLDEAGDFSASITSTATKLGKNGDLDFTSVVLTGAGGPFNFTILNNDGPTGLVDSASLSTFLAAGAYTLTVTGNSFGNGQFGGNTTVTATSAAPEPASWGLMILGFLGAGSVVRMRRGVHAAA
ncbi:MAG: FxDxF family PEP-CTERM protein [Pseudomonadota bacterium]